MSCLQEDKVFIIGIGGILHQNSTCEKVQVLKGYIPSIISNRLKSILISVVANIKCYYAFNKNINELELGFKRQALGQNGFYVNFYGC